MITMLTVLFVGLKLTGHIDWSWWWVLCLVPAQAIATALKDVLSGFGKVLAEKVNIERLLKTRE